MNISRRGWLTGFGLGAGALMLQPFMRQAFAMALPARRFVFVVEGNCIEPITLTSQQTQLDIDAQATSASIGMRWSYNRYGHSAPIEVAAGELNTAKALDHLGTDLSAKSAVLLGLSSRITGGGHSSHFGALSSSRSTSSRPAGQTIDAWLSLQAAVRGTTPFDAVRVGMDDSNGILANYACAFAAGRSAPVTLDPTLAHNNLFGFIPGSAGETSFARRSMQLDFALDDVNAALATFPGNSRERAKLEAYLDSLLVIRQRQDDLSAVAAAIDPLDPSTAFPAPEDPSTNPLYGTGDHFDILESQFQNLTSALLGGLTNVGVITSGVGAFAYVDYARVLQNHPGVPAGLQRHDLQHGAGGDPAGTGAYVDAVHDVSREHVRLIANMARALDAVPEGNGTMLDHTAIVYLSDNGEQHHSSASEWPVLVIGGSELGLRTDGRTIVYPGADHANNRQMSNLFNTLGYAAGGALDDFGEEGGTRITEGPLSELLS
jgi:hypothetical protein